MSDNCFDGRLAHLSVYGGTRGAMMKVVDISVILEQATMMPRRITMLYQHGGYDWFILDDIFNAQSIRVF